MNNDDIRFLVKFGKKEHIQDIPDGRLYFTNAKRLVEIEREKEKKGQGDAGEGKTKFAFERATLRHPITNEIIREMHNSILDVGYEIVPYIPVFCMTAGYEKDLYRNHDGSVVIRFEDRIKNEIKKSFDEADSALIIKSPRRFIHDVYNHFDSKCEGGAIHYYPNMSKGIVTLQMVDFIADKATHMREDEIQELMRSTSICNRHAIENNTWNITTENVYRILFCKDEGIFSAQQEFRFVAFGHSISEPQTIHIDTMVDAELVDIESFFDGYRCFLKEGSE